MNKPIKIVPFQPIILPNRVGYFDYSGDYHAICAGDRVELNPFFCSGRLFEKNDFVSVYKTHGVVRCADDRGVLVEHDGINTFWRRRRGSQVFGWSLEEVTKL